MGASFSTEKSNPITLRTKLSDFVCDELCKHPSYGSISEYEVEARGYHAFVSGKNSEPSTNLCDILINPITLNIDFDKNSCIGINILQDVRAHYYQGNWTHQWVRIKFQFIDSSNNILTKEQINQINYGIEIANKKTILPTWHTVNNCQKTLKDEVCNHQIIKGLF